MEMRAVRRREGRKGEQSSRGRASSGIAESPPWLGGAGAVQEERTGTRKYELATWQKASTARLRNFYFPQ